MGDADVRAAAQMDASPAGARACPARHRPLAAAFAPEPVAEYFGAAAVAAAVLVLIGFAPDVALPGGAPG